MTEESAPTPREAAPPRERLFFSLALALLVLAFFAPLLRPSRVLATRDMTEFNLPLRLSWAKLATEAPAGGALHLFPQWDPYAHGGQPLLSNPNYGALYPPAWVGLLVPERYAIGLLAVLQGLVAAFGAARLARRLGADSSGALLAGLAFAAGPTYLALLQSLIQALGFSWLPWILDSALARLEPGARRSFDRTALLFAASVALFLLSGSEPGMLMLTGLALALLVLARPRSAIDRARRLVPPFLFGVALAAIQALPTLVRLADSPRAKLDFARATLWSLPWARWPELFFPRVYGDVARPMHGQYFGWGVHDFDYPFLTSISLTVPLALLGLAALLGGRLAPRAYWTALAALGLFFALGGHNPLYGWPRDHLPLFDSLRYPEKFFLLTLFALLFAGATAWRRILDERDRGVARGVELSFALAAMLVLLAAGFAAAIRWRPGLLDLFLAARTSWELSPAELARATAFYRDESLAALAFALSAAALFAAVRWSRLPRRALELGLVALVVAELGAYSRPLLRTVRAADLFAPPEALAAELARVTHPGGRIFSTGSYQSEKNLLVPVAGDTELNWVRAPLERLSSRAGNLLGLSYALDRDFDLTLTRSGARALALYEYLREDPPLAHRLLGAWSIERLAVQRAPQSIAQDLRRGRAHVPTVTLAANSFALPPVRFLSDYTSYPTVAAAERAALGAGLPLNTTEFVVGAPAPASTGGALGVATLELDDDRGDERRIDYRSAAPSLLIVAATYDRNWRARIGGSELPLYETAGGYMAAIVPAGEESVELRFRDPWFGVGAALSAAALLLFVLLAARSRRLRAA